MDLSIILRLNIFGELLRILKMLKSVHDVCKKIYAIFSFRFYLSFFLTSFTAVIVITLLCGLFFAGYMIGAKFFSAAKIKVVSIVIMPMILSLLIFGLGIIAVPVVSMLMQYPVIILSESLGIDMLLADNSILFYIIVILYHLLCCLSLLTGSHHKKHTQ